LIADVFKKGGNREETEQESGVLLNRREKERLKKDLRAVGLTECSNRCRGRGWKGKKISETSSRGTCREKGGGDEEE